MVEYWQFPWAYLEFSAEASKQQEAGTHQCTGLGFLPRHLCVTLGRSPTLIVLQFTALKMGVIVVPHCRVVLKIKSVQVYKVPREGPGTQYSLCCCYIV